MANFVEWRKVCTYNQPRASEAGVESAVEVARRKMSGARR